MTDDKYTALWLSYSSISDFLSCPRAYYLKNIYRDPSSGNKVQIAAPPLSLGSAVHEVMDLLSNISSSNRFKEPFTVLLDRQWHRYSGKKGGFTSKEIEKQYRDRAEAMLSYLYQNPGPLKNLAVKIKMDLPYYWLSKSENIILCGKIDWLEYLSDQDSVHIIDFKTGQRTEKKDSLQLPIYYLLATNCQQRPVIKQSYWYLEKRTPPEAQEIASYEKSEKILLDIGLKIKTARKPNSFNCPNQGCSFCRPYEQIVKGKAELVGTSSYNVDLYLISKERVDEPKSIIL